MNRILSLVLTGGVLALGGVANADPIIQFAATGNATGVVSYDNSSGIVSGSDIPVYVTLFTPNSYGPNPVQATFSFSADTAGPAFSIFGGLIEGVSTVSNVSFSLTADTAVGGDTDILSGSASNGSFTGNSSGFSLSGQNTGSPDDGIVYNSDFIDTSSLTDYSLQFNFPVPLNGDSDAPGVNDGVLDSFTADLGPGTFVASPVPEPATFSMIGLGAAMLLRRRRHA